VTKFGEPSLVRFQKRLFIKTVDLQSPGLMSSDDPRIYEEPASVSVWQL
jgi:hypothetical protein